MGPDHRRTFKTLKTRQNNFLADSFCPVGMLPETTTLEPIYHTIGWQAMQKRPVSPH